MRIIHAADFHLDSPFDGLTPEQAVARRGEQRQVLQRLAELARSSQAELILLPGDLLDSERVYQETVETLSRTLGQLGVPVFIAPGNHDYYTARSPYAVNQWPDNVHIFRSGRIEAVELPELNAVVYGAAFTADGRSESLLSGFSVPEDGRLHIMALHADVDARQGSRYCPVSTDDIAASGLDYLALGHIHACSGVCMAGSVPWAYSGCPEGRGFDELGVKGVLCGKIEHGKADLRFVPLCQRQYQILELPVTTEDDVGSIANKALSLQLAEGGGQFTDFHRPQSSLCSKAARPKRVACWIFAVSSSLVAASSFSRMQRRNRPVRFSSLIRSQRSWLTRVRSRKETL